MLQKSVSQRFLSELAQIREGIRLGGMQNTEFQFGHATMALGAIASALPDAAFNCGKLRTQLPKLLQTPHLATEQDRQCGQSLVRKIVDEIETKTAKDDQPS